MIKTRFKTAVWICLLLAPILLYSKNFAKASKKISFTSGGQNKMLNQLLIKKGILTPITSSAADFEIRIITSSMGHQLTKVISCSNGVITAVRYDAFAAASVNGPHPSTEGYKNLGKFDTDSSAVWYRKVPYNSNKPVVDCTSFQKKLTEYDLSNLPDQQTLDALARKDDPNVTRTPFCCGMYIEAKLGGKVTYIFESADYSPTVHTATYVQHKQALINLFNNL